MLHPRLIWTVVGQNIQMLVNAAETTASAPALAGVVVIFDSADGGIMGATLPSVKQFAEGTLSSGDFWKQCYLDPPDAFQESRKP